MSEKFQSIYENSINNPEKFWQEASENIFWFKKPTKILNKSNPPFYKWFEAVSYTHLTLPTILRV